MAKLTQSYVHGVSATPLIGETIGVHFDKAAAQWGARDALIVRQQNVRWSYGELKARVDAFAAGLLALGLAPGDRVGIWSPNNSEWVITQFATAKAGLILADTKFEFGLLDDTIILADEVLTPDSSRYWPAATYNPGGPQPSFDKQYVRDYLESIHWNKQAPAPALPDEVVSRTREKYLEAFRLITDRPNLAS